MDSELRDAKDPDCAGKTEINEYIEDLEVEIFITNQNLDFIDEAKYYKKPLNPI